MLMVGVTLIRRPPCDAEVAADVTPIPFTGHRSRRLRADTRNKIAAFIVSLDRAFVFSAILVYCSLPQAQKPHSIGDDLQESPFVPLTKPNKHQNKQSQNLYRTFFFDLIESPSRRRSSSLFISSSLPPQSSSPSLPFRHAHRR